jgi:diaminopimelate decarboxylase
MSFKTNFLDNDQIRQLVLEYGTPLFVYSRAKLRAQATLISSISPGHDLTVRYAMKANPHPEILATFKNNGLKLDASSAYEVDKAINLGFEGHQILLTSQQFPKNLKNLVSQGVEFNATSLHQLEEYGKLFPNSSVSVRVNPGIGSGHSSKTNVGGVTSSFGIWHEQIPDIHAVADRYHLTIKRLHTHIGAGTDPVVWERAAETSLELIRQFKDANILNLGGGFKVGRMDDERSVNISQVGRRIVDKLDEFSRMTGRNLKLELEPGTFLVANAGILLCTIDDIVTTGNEGYNFIKLDTGMNDILRPTLYGAQHPIEVINDSNQQQEYVVVGHNCESGDILTPEIGQPEVLSTRRLNKASIGDVVLIGGTGAYCASMSAHGYNSFPSAKEIVIG